MRIVTALLGGTAAVACVLVIGLGGVAAEWRCENIAGNEEPLREVAENGSFVPAESKKYSMIRVPGRMVEAARQSSTPVTWSLCAEENDIRLFHNALGPDYHAPGPEQIENCSPWVQEYEGRMTIEYYSGQPGVFGPV